MRMPPPAAIPPSAAETAFRATARWWFVIDCRSSAGTAPSSARHSSRSRPAGGRQQHRGVLSGTDRVHPSRSGPAAASRLTRPPPVSPAASHCRANTGATSGRIRRICAARRLLVPNRARAAARRSPPPSRRAPPAGRADRHIRASHPAQSAHRGSFRRPSANEPRCRCGGVERRVKLASTPAADLASARSWTGRPLRSSARSRALRRDAVRDDQRRNRHPPAPLPAATRGCRCEADYRLRKLGHRNAASAACPADKGAGKGARNMTSSWLDRAATSRGGACRQRPALLATASRGRRAWPVRRRCSRNCGARACRRLAPIVERCSPMPVSRSPTSMPSPRPPVPG